MKRILLFTILILWGSLLHVQGQRRLKRNRFEKEPLFEENFSYSAGYYNKQVNNNWANDSVFIARWQVSNKLNVGNSGTQYYWESALEMTGHSLLIHGDALAQLTVSTQEKAAIAAAKRPNAESGAVAYRTGELISVWHGAPTIPALDEGGYEGFTYGLFEIRCKLPATQPGIWPAFWLHSPHNEIDIIDNTTGDATTWQLGVLDWKKRYTPAKEGGCYLGRDSSQQDSFVPNCNWTSGTITDKHVQDLSQDYNVYSAVWTPDKVVFYLNEKRVFTAPASAVKTQRESMRIILNLATRDNATFRSEAMEIDFIRIYSRKE